MLSPVFDGIHQDSLVEVCGSHERCGQRGQLLSFEDDMFGILMHESGEVIQVDPNCVRACTDLKYPGEGGDEHTVDMVLGPATDLRVLGVSIAGCLHNKGFCVLKTIGEASALQACFDELKNCDNQNMFSRLPKEVEEGQLGTSGRAKTMRLDPTVLGMPVHELLWASDSNIDRICETFGPYVANALGCEIAERTSAMVCLSMTDEEEDKYLHPEAQNHHLLDHYNIWKRGKLRVIHFMGPETGEVTLLPKDDAPIESLNGEYKIAASPHTILLVREDSFRYAYDEPEEGESCWLQCFLLEPGPEWILQDFQEESVASVMERGLDGPPPPQNNLVAVAHIALHAGGDMCTKEKEWSAYTAGTDGQLEIPLKRFDYRPYYTDDDEGFSPGQTYVKHFSVQEGIDLFDNKAFDISISEATCIDPINRQVLEVSYTMILNNGYTKKYLNSNPVHASVSVGNDKQEWLYMPDAPSSVAANNQLAIMANRVNYVFNLKGGSYMCDTACSSSLVAGHLGKLALLEARWDPLAFHIAMGAGLTLTVNAHIGSCAAHMLSAYGRCLTFNASANGYNRGDGTGGLLLKRGEGVEDKLAFLRGTQMGNDGRSASMSAPNGPAQEKCIWGAVREAQMTPPESTVWECHGTGTSLGDPIEVGAVRKVQVKEARKEPLMIGTSKSNLGHLEGSAAALAMVKCVMVVCKCSCPATIHLRTLNPHLDHTKFEAFFCTEMNPYLYNQGHCQVSSFGVGGTNGHAIFWGESLKKATEKPDYKTLFMRRMQGQVPMVQVTGNDPLTWKLSGPGVALSPGETYQVMIERDAFTGTTPIIWQKVEDAERKPEFFSMTGNFNDWKDTRMEIGDVPGLFYLMVFVPDAGEVQFRCMVEADNQRSFGPSEESTRKRTAKISYESANCTTFWIIADAPGTCYRVELTVTETGSKAITWFPVEPIEAEETEEKDEEQE